METHNTKMTTIDESPVLIDEVTVREPVDAEIESLREELDAEREKYLRLAAEYENYRRRTKREQAAAADMGKRELLERLISLADDFELALANVDDASDKRMIEGLEMIGRRLKAVLEANEVVPFKSTGEVFNPELHEAFDVVSDPSGKPGRINSELRCGYFWNDKLLRPALVVVNQ
ncbi:MAG: nucleotide exchange factor GrpE [Pyrinomonadaceae bacterium]|nr:nucleotide exchange factor GrpE [Pyrinomonadaceae bacterium]